MSPSIPQSATGFLVPQALLLDERLMPLERNAWLVFRSLAGVGVTPFSRTEIQAHTHSFSVEIATSFSGVKAFSKFTGER